MSAIASFVRWRDWGPGKVPVLFSLLYYLGLANQEVGPSFITDFLFFISLASLCSALGFVVNDWGDRELDARHGKPNAFVQLTRVQGLIAVWCLAILAVLPGLHFLPRPRFLVLWAVWLFCNLAYSLKPLRLKERGAWGLIASTLAQWPLPILLAFAALNRFGGWDMLLYAAAVTANGMTLEIGHQRFDRARDLGTQTQTLGVRLPTRRLDRLYAVALVLDKVALGAIAALCAAKLGWVRVAGSSLLSAIPIAAVYAILLALSLRETAASWRRGEVQDPYYSPSRSASKLLHETFPNVCLPAYLALLGTACHPANALLLGAFLYWRLILGQADWSWPLRALSEAIGQARGRR